MALPRLLLTGCSPVVVRSLCCPSDLVCHLCSEGTPPYTRLHHGSSTLVHPLFVPNLILWFFPLQPFPIPSRWIYSLGCSCLTWSYSRDPISLGASRSRASRASSPSLWSISTQSQPKPNTNSRHPLDVLHVLPSSFNPRLSPQSPLPILASQDTSLTSPPTPLSPLSSPTLFPPSLPSPFPHKPPGFSIPCLQFHDVALCLQTEH